MRFATVMKINEDRSVLIPEAFRPVVGFESGSTVYFQLIESTYALRTDTIEVASRRYVYNFIEMDNLHEYLYGKLNVEDIHKTSLISIECIIPERLDE